MAHEKPMNVWMRRCPRCGCWFGTPRKDDLYCSSQCENWKPEEQKEQKIWPKARKVER
jgi:hypothetical protein